MHSKPLVSIIIPVYNAENYISQCIESVLSQSYQSFEIIIVDDGSTDTTLEILNKYAECDERIFIHCQENQFTAVARNNGFCFAKGKYVFFLDADDYLHQDMLQKTVEKAEECSAEIVVFDAFLFNNKYNSIENANYLKREMLPEKDVFSAKDIPDSILSFSNPAVWTKLYLRSFLEENNIKFPEYRFIEDLPFSKLAFALASRITYVDECLIYYRIGIQSNLQSMKINKKCEFIEALQYLYDKLTYLNDFKIIEKSFIEHFIATVLFELNPYHSLDLDKRFKVYNYVFSAPITQKVLSFDESYYLNHDNYIKIKRLMIAVDFRNKVYLDSNVLPSEIIFKSKDIDLPTFSVIIKLNENNDSIFECLDSVYSQAFNDYEIILTANSNEIDELKSYCMKANQSISLSLYLQNGNHNAALRNSITVSKGKYVIILDSNDIMHEQGLETIEKNSCDEDVVLLAMFKDEMVYSYKTGIESFEYFVSCGDYLSGDYREVVKRSFLNRCSFLKQTKALSFDDLFFFHILLNAGSIKCLNGDSVFNTLYSDPEYDNNRSYINVHNNFMIYYEMFSIYCNNESDDLWREHYSSINKLIKTYLKKSRVEYRVISSQEKLFYFGYDDIIKQLFESLVVDYSAQQYQAIISNHTLEKERNERRLVEERLLYEEKRADKAEQIIIEKDTELEKAREVLANKASEIDTLQETINSISNSYSYRVGCFFTWLPRKIKALLK